MTHRLFEQCEAIPAHAIRHGRLADLQLAAGHMVEDALRFINQPFESARKLDNTATFHAADLEAEAGRYLQRRIEDEMRGVTSALDARMQRLEAVTAGQSERNARGDQVFTDEVCNRLRSIELTGEQAQHIALCALSRARR